MSDVLSTGVGLVATAIGLAFAWAALDLVMFLIGRYGVMPGSDIIRARADE